DARIARRALSIVAAEELPWRRCLAYSRKPEEKMRSSAPPRFWVARWNNSFKSPPFQKSSSKRSVSRAARLSANSLRKICHHDQSEARSSSAMTACTTTLACITIATKDRSGWRIKLMAFPRVDLGGNRRGNSRRSPVHRIEAGERHPRVDQLLVAAKNILYGGEAAAAQRRQFQGDLKRIVQARRLTVDNVQPMDDEESAVVALQGGQREAERRQPFGAGALEEFQVIGVINDPAGVGILIVNAHRPAKGLDDGHSRKSSPAAAGGTSPKW